MINVFFDKHIQDWQITTRSSIGANVTLIWIVK